ncbi:MAG: hypothetical protein SVU69_09100 [Pseudomonadota bacterium]|nr:hypothetical protein [Pseudomonadota bacterium]
MKTSSKTLMIIAATMMVPMTAAGKLQPMNDAELRAVAGQGTYMDALLRPIDTMTDSIAVVVAEPSQRTNDTGTSRLANTLDQMGESPDTPSTDLPPLPSSIKGLQGPVIYIDVLG